MPGNVRMELIDLKINSIVNTENEVGWAFCSPGASDVSSGDPYPVKNS